MAEKVQHNQNFSGQVNGAGRTTATESITISGNSNQNFSGCTIGSITTSGGLDDTPEHAQRARALIGENVELREEAEKLNRKLFLLKSAKFLLKVNRKQRISKNLADFVQISRKVSLLEIELEAEKIAHALTLEFAKNQTAALAASLCEVQEALENANKHAAVKMSSLEDKVAELTRKKAEHSPEINIDNISLVSDGHIEELSPDISDDNVSLSDINDDNISVVSAATTSTRWRYWK